MQVFNNTYPLSKAFVAIVAQVMEREELAEGSSFVLNFRDPSYSAEQGGFHPVEIMVAHGEVAYITDFSFVGSGAYAELAKELDFDFLSGYFQQMGREYPMRAGREIFSIFLKNFCAYHEMGTYEVEVSRG